MKYLQRFPFLWIPLLIPLLAEAICLLLGRPLTLPHPYFDSLHYFEIARNGYEEAWRTAFFPLFPFFWKLTGTSIIAIELINLTIWLAATYFLHIKVGVKRSTLLLANLVPSVLFFLVPYSEALFFVFCTITVIGVHEKKNHLIWLGILLAAMTRPTAAVLVPAVIFAEWARHGYLRRTAWQGIAAAVSGLIGVGIVFWIQWIYTDSFYSFFEVQSEYWGNGWSFPELPFHSWGGDLVTLLDQTALFVGLASGVTMLRVWRTRRNLKPVHYFGFAGLFFTALIIMFSRDGGIFSLNRFIFATCFFPLALDGWSRLKVFRKDIVVFFVGWILVALACGAYLHFRGFLYSMLLAGLVVAIFIGTVNKNTRWASVIMLLGITTYFMVEFLLRNKWIG